jgi:hypothetical protein
MNTLATEGVGRFPGRGRTRAKSRISRRIATTLCGVLVAREFRGLFCFCSFVVIPAGTLDYLTVVTNCTIISNWLNDFANRR